MTIDCFNESGQNTFCFEKNCQIHTVSIFVDYTYSIPNPHTYFIKKCTAFIGKVYSILVVACSFSDLKINSNCVFSNAKYHYKYFYYVLTMLYKVAKDILVHNEKIY